MRLEPHVFGAIHGGHLAHHGSAGGSFFTHFVVSSLVHSAIYQMLRPIFSVLGPFGSVLFALIILVVVFRLFRGRLFG